MKSLPLILALCLGLALAKADEAAPVVLGYYPSWASNLPPEKIDFARFTHLVHAFVTLRQGELKVAGNLPSSDLTERAHKAGVKVLLGFGGADSGRWISAMTANADAQEACVRRLVGLALDNGYDGIDVDWEFPEARDADRVVSFVAALRDALRKGKPDALVTMPLPYPAQGEYFDGSKLASLVDFVQLMAYDAHGPWKIDGRTLCHAGFNAPLNETTTDPIDGSRYSFQKMADFWRGKGFADRQLVMGIHCFGHGFRAGNWGDTPAEPSPRGDIDYRKIPPLIANGWTRQWDDQAQVPWLRSPAGFPPELLTYDDPQSVELKGKWAKDAGLRGLFFWEITADWIDGKPGHNVLVEAGRKGFGLAP